MVPTKLFAWQHGEKTWGKGRRGWDVWRVTWKLTLLYVKQTANGNFLYDGGNSNRGSVSTWRGGMGRELGGRFKTEGTYVYLCLIHVDVWQRTTKFYKAITIYTSTINPPTYPSSIHSFTHPFIHSPIHLPSIHPSAHPSVHLPIHHLSIYLYSSFHPPTHPTFQTYIYTSSIYLFTIHSSTIHPPSTHPPSIHWPSTYLPFIHPPTH